MVRAPRRRPRLAVAAIATLVVVGACSGDDRAADAPPGASAGPSTSTSAPTSTTATTAPATTTTTTAVVPGSTATVATVTIAELGESWRLGCPVDPSELRAVTVDYLDFDGIAQRGVLVVHQDAVTAVATAFASMFAAEFPIRRIEPISAYGGSDEASMAADNTSAFNCRAATGSNPPRWSSHAYGLAIDINPIENPYLRGELVLPPEGAPYIDRDVDRPGMAQEDGPMVAAFDAVGWGWGGRWSDPIDYQHVSADDR